MDIKVYQTVKEKDGTISSYIHFSDDTTGKRLKSVCIQGKTQADFEKQIKKHMAKLESEKTGQDSGAALVENAIAAVKKGEK